MHWKILIFNISFSSGIFSSILKTAKVIPIHKSKSKLGFSNYHPILLLSNIRNIFRRLMYNRMYKLFSDKFTNSFLIIILSIRYNLVLDKKYSTVHALISLTENIPPIFKSWFTFCSDFHNYHTVSSTVDKMFKPS